MTSTMVAVDRDTGVQLDAEAAETAADNPSIYTWVDWSNQ